MRTVEACVLIHVDGGITGEVNICRTINYSCQACTTGEGIKFYLGIIVGGQLDVLVFILGGNCRACANIHAVIIVDVVNAVIVDNVYQAAAHQLIVVSERAGSKALRVDAAVACLAVAVAGELSLGEVNLAGVLAGLVLVLGAHGCSTAYQHAAAISAHPYVMVNVIACLEKLLTAGLDISSVRSIAHVELSILLYYIVVLSTAVADTDYVK